MWGQWITTTSINTVGNQVLCLAPLSNNSLAIQGYHVLNATGTTNFYEFGFRQDTNATVHFRTQTSTGGDETAREFSTPWYLGIGQSLYINVVQMGALNSTPKLVVTVRGLWVRAT